MRRMRNIAVLLVAAALPLSACGGTSSDTSKTVNVGVVIPLSGQNASIGNAIKKGYQLAEEQLNSANDKALDQKVNFIFADHGSKPEVGANEAERLIADKNVVGLTGSYDSAVSLTVAQVAERRGIPFVVPYSAANAITEQGFKNTFRTRPPSRIWTTEILNFFGSLKDSIGYDVKSMGVLGEDNEITTGMLADVKVAVPKTNMTLTSPSLYRSGTTDFLGVVKKMSDVQAIYGDSYLPDTINILRTMKAAGVHVPYVTIGTTLVHPELLKSPDVAENATGTSAWASDVGEGSKVFADAFEKKFNETPTDDSAYAYSAAYLFAEAVSTAKSSDPSKLLPVFRKHTFTNAEANIIPTPDGSISFDKKGQAVANILVRQVQDGKFVTVYPEENAAAPLKTGQWLPKSN